MLWDLKPMPTDEVKKEWSTIGELRVSRTRVKSKNPLYAYVIIETYYPNPLDYLLKRNLHERKTETNSVFD